VIPHGKTKTTAKIARRKGNFGLALLAARRKMRKRIFPVVRWFGNFVSQVDTRMSDLD
jgi:hypothetical protein